MTTTMGSLDLSALNNLYDETQYFWFESSAQPWGAGAHVTLYPQSEFTTSTHANYLKGQNILMNTDGFSLRNGTLPMMTLDNDSLDFNVIDTLNQTYTNVASFGATSSRIGKEASSHVNITSNGLYLYDNVNLVSYFTDNSFKVANMFSNGMVWSAYATGNINWDSDYTPFLLTQFKQTDTEGIIYYIPKTVSGTLTSGGSLNVDLRSLRDAGLLWESMVSYEYTGARVKYAWDSNGNVITYPEGFTYSFTNTSSICRLTINYTNSSGSSARNTLTKLCLQIPSYQQYPCLMVGGYADTSDWKDASTSGGSIGNSQWAPYPFIVGNGITKQVYDEENNPDGFEYNPSNAFTVDWEGNIESAGTITARNHSSPIGTRKVTTGSYSVASGNSYVTVPTTGLTRLSLEAGSWVINLSAQYASNATGRRGCAIYNVTASSRFGRSEVNQTAVSGTLTKLQTSIVAVLDTTTTITAQLSQNSNAQRTCDLVLEAMRIA